MTRLIAQFLARRVPLALAALMVTTAWTAAAFGQVDVTATGGLAAASYTTLKGAFDAINAGTHTTVITIGISASTTEGTTPATLNSSGAGLASYTSVLIQPTVDGVSISGNPATGFGVIQLKGSDNVTIDGDNPNTGGTNRNLTVNNTNTTTAIANSCIRIATAATVVTSADNNTIKNLNLNGNVTAGNSSLITSTTGSSNSSFVIYCGGNGGATATDAPTAITSVTANTAPSGTTINNLLIDNNVVNQAARAIVFNGAATSVSTGVTITNNTLGASGSPSPGTPPYTSPATTVYTKGIWVAGTSAITVTGNTVQNLMSYVGTTTTAIELNAAIGASVTINNNTVNNLTNNGTTSITKAIQVISASTSYTISGNSINNEQSLAGASGTDAIECSAAVTSGTIELNKICTVYGRATGTFGAYGINVTAGSNVTIKNNFISDINMNMSGGAAFSTTFGVHGIRLSQTTAANHKVYHNSVSLFGTMFGTAATSLLSSCLTVVSTAATGIDLRNNLLSNTLSGGTTSIAHVSLYLPSLGTSAMNLTNNNNAYFCGTDPARQGIGQAGTTAGTNFYLPGNFDPSMTTPATNMRAYTSTLSAAGTNDNASFASTSAAPFTSSCDLHIPAATSTKLESGGAGGTGVTTDIDAQTRPGPPGSVNGGATANDIGADEFDGTPLINNDIGALAFVDPTNGGSKPAGASFGPKASFQNFGLAAQTSIPVRYRVVGPAPSLLEIYNDVQSIASLASGASTTVTFTITSFAAGTYTIYAKAENPGDANALNDEITGTFEAIAPLCGTYQVGTGQPFPFNTLTNAVARLNSVGISCSVVFELTDATYSGSETFPITINSVPGASSTSTVTIKPSPVLGVNVMTTITGSSTTAILVINGGDFITIDGSSTGGSSRDLTIVNTSVSTSSGVVWGQTTAGADPATNNTFKNMKLVGSGNTQTLIGAGFGAVTIGAAGTDNDNNRIENNSVTKTAFGIYSAGISALNKNTGTVITKNSINGGTPDNVQIAGIFVAFEDGIQITDNSISELNRTTTSIGITIGLGVGANILSATSAEVSNATVTGNVIGTVVSTSTVGYTAAGIAYGQSAVGTTLIANNMISGVVSLATPIDGTLGIYVAGGAGTVKVYFNSVSMVGTRGAATNPSYALAINGTNPIVDVRNNILSNSQTSTDLNGKSYAIGLGYSAPYTNLTSDYNDLITSGTSAAFSKIGGLGNAAGSDRTTLAAWQAETGKDPNSIVANPLFISLTHPELAGGGAEVNVSTANLHIDQTGATSPVSNAGIGGTGILTDIDGQTRSLSSPEMGADEITTYTLTTNAVNGSVARNPVYPTYNPGASVELTATANACYHFVNWSGDASGTANPLVITMNADKNITANFAITTYDIVATAGPGGMITPAGTTPVNCGADQKYDITPDPCYHIAQVLVDGNPVPVPPSGPLSYTFMNVQAGHTIDATFAIDTYTITTSAGPGGMISPLGVTNVNCDGTLKVDITPDPCYRIDTILVDGNPIMVPPSGPLSIEFQHVMQNRTVHATFVLTGYTIMASAGPGGMISPSGSVMVICGTDQKFDITPDPGYHIDQVLVDGNPVTTPPSGPFSYTFTNVMMDHTIHASFAINQYTLDVNYVGMGTVTKDPDQPTYPHGASVMLTPNPAPGWTFVSWGGDASGNTVPLKVIMDGNKKIIANFADQTPPLVHVDSPNGGETRLIGGTTKLAWTASDLGTGVTSVDLRLSRDGGLTYEIIALGEPNDGTYDWLVTGPQTTHALLKVSAHDGATNTGEDTSDGEWTIEQPVATLLSMFVANPIANGVEVSWQLGDPYHFTGVTLERAGAAGGEWSAVEAAVRVENGLTIVTDISTEPGVEYQYRLAAVADNGQRFAFGPIRVTAGERITEFAFTRMGPNPTPAGLTVEFTVPSASRVRMGVLDVQGREVAILADATYRPGRYSATWNGQGARGPLPAGAYFVRFNAGGKQIVKRLMMVR